MGDWWDMVNVEPRHFFSEFGRDVLGSSADVRWKLQDVGFIG